MDGRIKRWWTRLASMTFGSRRSAGSGPVGFAGAPRRGDDESTPRPWLDLPTLMSIQSLELRVRRLVQGLQRGIHRSVRRHLNNRA